MWFEEYYVICCRCQLPPGMPVLPCNRQLGRKSLLPTTLAGRGTAGGMGWWIETDVELRAFKGV